MESIQKIFKNPKFRLLAVFLVFMAVSGFLFSSIPRVVYAQDAGVQDVLGNSLSRADIITVDTVQNSTPTGCSMWSPLTCFLGLVLGFVKILLIASGALFGWIVKPENQTAISGQPIIYNTWMMVRDLLNVAFIMALLFSAFATIFQVEKYSYKKLLLNLILMALLVNFSFPIARFIIDLSNVLMYSLINRMTLVGPAGTSDATATMGALAFGSQFAQMLNVKNNDATYLISAIIFGFILAITLLAIAVMFVIRMVALAILIIFSPIAFVAAIIPDTSSYSSKWWSQLFKYCFFGPIMIFMLYISSALIIQIGSISTMKQFQSQVVNQASASADVGVIAAVAFYSIPIVILWFGMGVAQSMGIAGAATVMGAAQKVSKGSIKKFSGANAVTKRYGAYKAERKKRADERFKDNWGSTLGKGLNKGQDTVYAAFGSEKAKKRLAGMRKDSNKEDIKKASEGNEGDNAPALIMNINKAITSPPKTKQDHISAAGQVKQALSRGKEFEMEVENQIATGGIIIPPGAITVPPGTGLPQLRQMQKAWYYAQTREIISKAEKAK